MQQDCLIHRQTDRETLKAVETIPIVQLLLITCNSAVQTVPSGRIRPSATVGLYLLFVFYLISNFWFQFSLS